MGGVLLTALGCGDGLETRLDSAALRVSVAQIPPEARTLEVVAVRHSDGAERRRAPGSDPAGALTVYFDTLDAGYYALDDTGRPAGCAGRDVVELTGAGTAIAIELTGLDAVDCFSMEPAGDDEVQEEPPQEEQPPEDGEEFEGEDDSEHERD
jgi:hypothetical protein